VKESDIEKLLVQRVKEHGGLSLKLACTGQAGTPDRLIIGAYGLVAFVEVKAPGKKPRKLQEKRIQELKRLGCKVYVIDDYEGVENIMKEVF